MKKQDMLRLSGKTVAKLLRDERRMIDRTGAKKYWLKLQLPACVTRILKQKANRDDLATVYSFIIYSLGKQNWLADFWHATADYLENEDR